MEEEYQLNRLKLTFVADLNEQTILCIRKRKDNTFARSLIYHRNTPPPLLGLTESEISQWNKCREELGWDKD